MAFKSKKEQDLDTLANAIIVRLSVSDEEYGAIGVDCKRPFGNSSVEADMLEIIGETPEGDDGHGPCWSSQQRDYVRGLYHEELCQYIQDEWRRLRATRS